MMKYFTELIKMKANLYEAYMVEYVCGEKACAVMRWMDDQLALVFRAKTSEEVGKSFCGAVHEHVMSPSFLH